jgi:hypothetical protein
MPLIKGFSVMGVRAGEYGRQFPDKGRENAEAVWRMADRGRDRRKVAINAELPAACMRRAAAAALARGVRPEGYDLERPTLAHDDWLRTSAVQRQGEEEPAAVDPPRSPYRDRSGRPTGGERARGKFVQPLAPGAFAQAFGLMLTAPAPSLIHRPSLAEALRPSRPIIIGATS